MTLRVGLATAIATAQQGEVALARNMFAGIIQTEPENASAWLWMSQLVEKDDQRVYCLLRVLMIDGQNEAAFKGLSQLLGFPVQSIQDIFTKAMDSFWHHQWAQAKTLFDHLVNADSTNEEFWLWSSRVAGSMEERRRCLRKIIEINPGNKTARLYLDRLGDPKPKQAPVKKKRAFRACGFLCIATSLAILIYLASVFLPVRRQPTNPINPTESAVLGPVSQPNPDATAEQEMPELALNQTPVPEKFFEPGRIQIPDLGLDSQVVDVPLQNGTWDISALGNQVGLLGSTGRTPGEDHSMVFIGHVTLSALKNGPFYGIRFLRQGDRLTYIWDNNEYIYQVEDYFVISPDQVETLYSFGGDTILLVTCSEWSYNTQSYTKRSVTRAVLIEQKVLS